jgi:dsRNA-specific ribonuclease
LSIFLSVLIGSDVGRHLNGTETINKAAKSIGLDVVVASKLLVCFPAVSYFKPDGMPDIVIADAFRAFIGAVCLDQGLKAAQMLTLELLIPFAQSLDITTFLHLQHPRLTLKRILAIENRPPPETR